MTQAGGDEGCCGCFALLLGLGLLVAGLISVAALVDPFDLMPTVGEIWADCEEAPAWRHREGGCDLATRFPGFWGHVVLNLVYAAAALVLLLGLAGAAAELRDARAVRFDSPQAAEAYARTRATLATAALLLAALAALPIVVALLRAAE